MMPTRANIPLPIRPFGLMVGIMIGRTSRQNNAFSNFARPLFSPRTTRRWIHVVSHVENSKAEMKDHKNAKEHEKDETPARLRKEAFRNEVKEGELWELRNGAGLEGKC